MSEGLPPAELKSAAEGPRRVVAPKEVLRAAAMHFLRSGGLDMDVLAAELNVSRATLYRVAGSRDELLAEAFWAIDRKLFTDAAAENPPRDVESVIGLTRTFAEWLAGPSPLRQFFTTEPETATRLFISPVHGVYRRSVYAQRDIFRAAGVLSDLSEEELLARSAVYVRIVELVLFGDLIGPIAVSFAVAEPALRSLLIDEVNGSNGA
ncbi:AcrR family transcriptional regulator [Actinoplanes tereljensis]|uniref:QsdR TetR regulatory C-terminal domain-containing protein n=1 Tax=Paractinoplanes tereljensis TaxID=571912 RepID=A0A919NV06_9ACTN|nr:QsdR family transcriptional regulator [Actinoplanes tereljensis]GIF24765.1 hypothetical protein Ate02nite_74950 [Actinoplanes tereljensis]